MAEQLARPGAEHSVRMTALVLALWAPILVRRSHPIAATCAAAVTLAAVAGLPDIPMTLAAALPVVLSYSCGAHAATRPSLAANVMLIVAIQVNVGFSDAPNVEILIATLPPWWAGLQVRRRRRLVEELTHRTHELEAEEERFIQLSVQRERARIARDLHDIVSHHLIAMVIQAGAGRLAEPWRANDADGRLATIREAGAQALAETDRLVMMLDGDETATPRLALLLDRAQATGARVVVIPAALALPSEIETIAYRVIQEALTNAMKHAPGAAVDIRVERGDHELTITVRNDTVTTASAITDTGSGLGLAGMRDRLTTLGGQLDAGAQAGDGFHVCARLPIPRTSSDRGTA